MDRTIVVIEDEPVIRRQTVDSLTAGGLKVVDFDSGERALAYIEDNLDEVAAVFSDIKLMGDAEGARIAAAILDAHPTIIVVITCGDATDLPFEPGSRMRAIGKPWEALDVLNAIIDAELDD